MISGLVDACFGCWLALSAAATGGPNLDSLLASLAREPPQKIAFVETHRSPLLERDLVVSGVLEFRGKDSLSRIVTEPYQERTDIDGSDVRIQREGRPERRFSLRRSQELGGMLSAFSSLLAGDRAALESVFDPSVEFAAGGWRLDLVPRQSGRQDRVAKIRVTGAGDAPACIAVLMQDGSATTVIRLGETNPAAEAADSGACAEPNGGQ
jgi:Outer membrane lipoprotein carrier protein LolA-like